MKHNGGHSYGLMILFMVVAGLLSTMNVWVDRVEHIRFHLNDLYMIALMTSWMILFMAVYAGDLGIALLSGACAGFVLWCIRTQAFVSSSQYYLGMIPHHSMAIHMSKQLVNKGEKVNPLVLNIIQTQEKEIELMKTL